MSSSLAFNDGEPWNKTNALWEQIRQDLRDKLQTPAFNMHINPVIPISFSDGVLYLEVPTQMNLEYIMEEYRTLIEECAARAAGAPVAIRAKLSSDLHIQRPARAAESTAGQPASGGQTPPPEPPEKKVKTFFNPRYVFDSFVVGANNRLCHAASLAVAEAPGKSYNPLFIYGGVGLGKTHLMQAIGHYISHTRPNLSIKYITTDMFISDYVTAIQENRHIEFRNSFQKTDLLLVDDIQFLQGKERTQYEFLHIFNMMHESHKQIVITCDRLPKDIPTIEDRLMSRLNWGLVADIKPPDFETRLAILHKKLTSDGFTVPDGALELIAERVKTNIRQLEGILTRIIAISNFNGQEITLGLVSDVLDELIQDEHTGPTSIEKIIKETSAYYGIPESEIIGKKRKREIVTPRKVAMFLCRELTDASLEKIGSAFNKDHTTVLYACESVAAQIKTDMNMAHDIEQIRARLGPR